MPDPTQTPEALKRLCERLDAHLRQMDAFQWEGAPDLDPRPLLTEAAAAISALMAELAATQKAHDCDTDIAAEMITTLTGEKHALMAERDALAKEHDRLVHDLRMAREGGPQ